MRRWLLIQVCFAGLVLGAVGCKSRALEPASGMDGGTGCDLRELRCTGLYGPAGEGWATKTVAADVRAYTPGLTLWSDGLTKARYIYLPPGTKVDGQDPDEWRFPVGTKLWKEFSWKGRRIETRFLWKRDAETWLRTTYRWNDAGTQALELTRGEKDVPGTEHHEIPSQADCGTCHGGRKDFVLGFEAVALAHEDARGLTLAELVKEDRLSHPPAVPPRIPGDATSRAALGTLHMNCGVSCHNGNGDARGAGTGLLLRLEAGELGAVEKTDAFRTAVGQKALLNRINWEGAGSLRVAAGRSGESSLVYRMASRDEAVQMPSLGTHVVDAEGLARVKAWVDAMVAAPVPAAR